MIIFMQNKERPWVVIAGDEYGSGIIIKSNHSGQIGTKINYIQDEWEEFTGTITLNIKEGEIV